MRSVLEDGTILIDDGFRIVPVRNPAGVKAVADNTVDYNEIEGIVRILSETPIRSARISGDDEKAADEFLGRHVERWSDL